MVFARSARDTGERTPLLLCSEVEMNALRPSSLFRPRVHRFTRGCSGFIHRLFEARFDTESLSVHSSGELFAENQLELPVLS